MRTLQEKYNGVNEGAFSKDQFLRDARLQLPNLVTRFNGYDDAVQILKNRGMIQEEKSEMSTAEILNKIDKMPAGELAIDIFKGVSKDVLDSLKTLAKKGKKKLGDALVKFKYITQDELDQKLGKQAEKEVEEGMLQNDYETALSRDYDWYEKNREYKPGFKVIFKNKTNGEKYEATVIDSLGPGRFTYTAKNGTEEKEYNHNTNSDLQITQVINNNDPDADPTGLGKWAKLTPRQKADMDAARAQMQEATQPKPTKKGLADYRYKPTNDMDKYPYEQILRGLRVELETLGVAGTPTPEEYTKALAKVLKNLEKDGIYYTNQIAGIKSNRKRTDLMIDATPKTVVDKENGLQKAALKEAIKSVIKNILKEDDSSVSGLYDDEDQYKMYPGDRDVYGAEEVDEELWDLFSPYIHDDSKIQSQIDAYKKGKFGALSKELQYHLKDDERFKNWTSIYGQSEVEGDEDDEDFSRDLPFEGVGLSPEGPQMFESISLKDILD